MARMIFQGETGEGVSGVMVVHLWADAASIRKRTVHHN
jgi:hypothetical protein